jgi:hypothetical protein
MIKVYRLADDKLIIKWDWSREYLESWLQFFPEDLKEGLRVEEVEVDEHTAIDLCEPLVCGRFYNNRE